MRVLIIAAGSRGDVAPYVGLGQRIRDAGHSVAVAAHRPFGELVRENGLEFREIPGELADLVSHAPDSSLSPRFMAQRIKQTTRYFTDVGRGVLDVAKQGADVLLQCGTVPFGYHVAKGLGIPSMGVYLQPIEPSGDFPPILFHTARSIGQRANRTLGHMALASLFPLNRVVNELRAELRLPRIGPLQTLAEQRVERWPIFHGFSPAVLPRPADWRDGLSVVGYWWPPSQADWSPPQELVDFLSAGPPPVFIGFGSMAAGHGQRLSALVGAAVRHAGVRAVVQRGWAGLSVPADDVLTVGEVPHEWLFPQVSAVVQHAGAGTTGAALRAGVPTVAVPMFADQPLWASRIVALGVGPAPVRMQHLTPERLGDAIRQALAWPRYRTNAARLAERIRAEDGTAPVVEALHRLSTGESE
ncbi:glycosyltransferase [Saccharopolyspora sp. K220]|uniref:glycosyltransferase n=1 Tax=Saccharopolyspora soli TaxID=2926618 RepID=UPI001F584C2A|nr:glycosyltransferase [Saccharopolyspora soli]MCI2418747.1 glycosyltransferase [Saccharopolyspora soli]